MLRRCLRRQSAQCASAVLPGANKAASGTNVTGAGGERYQPHRRHRVVMSFGRGWRLERAAYENPIQRPPHATPNHRANDMSAGKPAEQRSIGGQARLRHAAANRERKKEHQEQRRHLYPEGASCNRHLIDSDMNNGIPDANIKITLPINHGCSACPELRGRLFAQARRLKGADQRSTRLPPSIRDRGGGQASITGNSQVEFRIPSPTGVW